MQSRSESKIFEAILHNHKIYFFAEPVLQTQIIFLNLYARNVYELDKGYLDIITTSRKIEKSWLFQNWIIDEINTRYFEKLK